MSGSEQPSRILTGQSEEAVEIMKALGLGGFHVRAIKVVIDADAPISVVATIYPTAEHIKALGGALERFRCFGTTIADVEFNYGLEGDDWTAVSVATSPKAQG